MRELPTFLLLSLFVCMNIGVVYAIGGRPIVQGLSCPDTILDPFHPAPAYSYSIDVTGGTPPYTYNWYISDMKLVTGTGETYSSATFTYDQLAQGESMTTHFYWVDVLVADSKGISAMWTDDPAGAAEGDNWFGCGLPKKDESSATSVVYRPTYPYTSLILKEQTQQENKTQVKPAAEIAYTPTKPTSSMAVFTSISREVEYSVDGKPPWDAVKMDTPILEGYHIRTGEDSTAIIGMADLSTFKLEPETEIEVTLPKEKNSKIAVIMGNIWANVKKIPTGGTLDVDMSQAVAGIKGTTFVVHVDSVNSTLKVIEGIVEFTSKADNKTTSVSVGKTITATKSGSGPLGTFDVASETQHWNTTVPDKVASSSPFCLGGFLIAGTGLMAYLSGREQKKR